MVIPTSQIFLTDADTFDTHGFNPWRQKTIYDYTRRDAPDTFELPTPLFHFFLAQLETYGPTSESTLQQLRNLRAGVLTRTLTPAQAASAALRYFADDLAGSNN